jgi:tRNA (guanine37-N1)-methyltransferase
MTHGSFDLLGNIAIVKFPEKTKIIDKKSFAKSIVDHNKSIKTVLEKTGKFKGRLRKQQTKHLFGEKTKEALYHENNCVFRFNVDEAYFSPRLSHERFEIAKKIKKGNKVFVMFAGVAPYSIVIAKLSNPKIVYSNEINKKANDYAKLNINLNKLKDKIILVSGDIKRIANQLYKKRETFDVIVMPRPQLKDNFLKEAFMLGRKNTMIYYYDFCKQDEINSVKNMIEKEAKNNKKKIKIFNIKKAGEISPYKYRIRIDFKIL